MNFYNEIDYDRLYKEEQINKLKLIKKQVKGKILDVGCGSFISKGFFKNIIGVDPYIHKGDVIGKAENLPFKDKSFDTIICITVLHHLDLDKTIREMKRVCKGKFVLSILKRIDKFKKIKKKIYEEFNVIKEIDEEKDLILIANQTFN